MIVNKHLSIQNKKYLCQLRKAQNQVKFAKLSLKKQLLQYIYPIVLMNHLENKNQNDLLYAQHLDFQNQFTKLYQPIKLHHHIYQAFVDYQLIKRMFIINTFSIQQIHMLGINFQRFISPQNCIIIFTKHSQAISQQKESLLQLHLIYNKST
ncbi:unnamed protein product [Paramecium primaurelia]|uniref:Uncharacterized protein n=1 Tax=Paramecium primaurelia TaxID=5886 RepID=A0A8S1MZX0_PARPR|nr:unnamed protein product [Paramecium primaurelia]